MTEQEQQAAADEERLREALFSQLLQQAESGDGEAEEGSSDDDDEDGLEDDDYEDDDIEEDDEDDEDDDDIRSRTFAFFGMGERTVQKQLAKHPKLADCQAEKLVHPAAQMLNLSCAAVSAADCLSAVGTSPARLQWLGARGVPVSSQACVVLS